MTNFKPHRVQRCRLAHTEVSFSRIRKKMQTEDSTAVRQPLFTLPVTVNNRHHTIEVHRFLFAIRCGKSPSFLLQVFEGDDKATVARKFMSRHRMGVENMEALISAITQYWDQYEKKHSKAASAADAADAESSISSIRSEKRQLDLGRAGGG